MDWERINFDWNRARSFLAVAENGSLSAAARVLNMTQPTLGRQISALESELGVTLFERVGNRLELTASALQLLPHLQAMRDNATAFSLTATGQTQSIEGTVVISASEVDAAFRLPRLIAGLHRQEPGIRIEIVVSNDASDLKRREADIAVRSFRPRQPDLIARKLGDVAIWMYGTEACLAPFQSQSRPDEFTDIPIIGFDRSGALLDLLNSQDWAVTERNFPVLTGNQLLQLELCRADLGLIVLPQDIGDAQASLVRAFPANGPLTRIPVWLVSHQELRTSARVRRVYDFLAAGLCRDLASSEEQKL